jgi:hypothetical protein
LRAGSGLRPVVAQPSDDAKACAESQGNGPTCAPHYIFTQLSDQNPATALQALESANRSWLLDSTTLRMEVGFVKLPDGGYECALLKFP